MRRSTLTLLLSIFFVTLLPLHAADKNESSQWLTNYKDAVKMAKKNKRPILMDFTGSDWCGWCIKLKKEVFDQKEFQAYANTDLVLLEVDFPRKKQIPAAEKKVNDALQKKYKIDGFPTIVLIDATGKEISRTGYREGGPDKYVEHLKSLLKK